MRLHPFQHRRMLTLVGIILCAGLIGTAPAVAAERRLGERIEIGRGEVVDDDLYLVGSTIVVHGTVKGDLVAVGANITVDGTIEGDVLAAGQTVVLNGNLQDDVRVAGMAVQLGPQARIADDLLSGAGSVEQQAGGMINGDAYVGANQALLAGAVNGDLVGAATGMVLRGTIVGDADVSVAGRDTVSLTPWSTNLGISTPAVPAGLTLGSDARIGGKLTYIAPQDGQLDPSASVEGGVARTATPAATTVAAPRYQWLVDIVRRYLTLLAIGALLVWLVPTWIGRVSTSIRARPLYSLGWGTLGVAGVIALLVLIPLIAVLLMVLFVWMTLGGLAGITLVVGTAAFTTVLTGFAVLVSYLVQILVGMVVGRWLVGLVAPHAAEGRFAPLAAGLLLYVVLRAIPIVGVLTALAVTLVGVGAIGQWLGSRLRRQPIVQSQLMPLA